MALWVLGRVIGLVARVVECVDFADENNDLWSGINKV